MPGIDAGAIGDEINRIRSLGLEDLRREWRRLYHAEPPGISRDLFVLALGYRLQEIAHGGLGKATRRKLQTMAKTLWTTGRVGPTPSLSLKPGARLVREWRGRTHTITVTEDAFEYGGMSYPSLTKIAKEITGAYWSGPRFFGLPALRRLIADIEAGQIDVVVVYKVDRSGARSPILPSSSMSLTAAASRSCRSPSNSTPPPAWDG